MAEIQGVSAELLDSLHGFVSVLEAAAHAAIHGKLGEPVETLLEETEKGLARATEENALNARALLELIQSVATGMGRGEFTSLEAPAQTLRHCADYLPQIRERLAHANERELTVQDETFIDWLRDDLAPHRQSPKSPEAVPPTPRAVVAEASAPSPPVPPPAPEKAKPKAPAPAYQKTPAAPAPSKATLAPKPPTAEPAAKKDGAEKESKGNDNANVAETIRVDIERLDHLMNLSGELVINKARFSQVVGAMRHRFQDKRLRSVLDGFSDRVAHLERSLENMDSLRGIDDLVRQVHLLTDSMNEIEGSLSRITEGRAYFSAMGEAVHQLSRLADGIQKCIMSTRMVPIGPLFARFKRVVRDMANASGKQVNLEIVGEQTELDKRMIDSLGDPLVHLIRNSVDHGLESPADRQKAGKPAAGRVRLEAAYAGNCVVVSIQDDGRGLNIERIAQKAIERQLTTPQEVAMMNDRQIAAFIWQPGFSTAEKVSDISGRGVGMDIVRRKIDELGGSVDLQSRPGEGTTFIIRLPLTLAIMQSLLARVGDVVYAVPLENVAEIVTVDQSNICQVGGRPVVNIRGEVLELLTLSDIFWWGDPNHLSAPTTAAHGTTEAPQDRPAVILQSAQSRAALVVDHLIGEEDIVIKSLAENLHQIRGLSGASILGDGTVALILDVRSLLELAVDPATTRRRELALANA